VSSAIILSEEISEFVNFKNYKYYAYTRGSNPDIILDGPERREGFFRTIIRVRSKTTIVRAAKK
jgi:hypothetical protein